MRETLSIGALLLMAVLAVAKPLPKDSQWERLGPFEKPSAGSVPAVHLHPKNPKVILAGTRPDGLMRSADGGKTWAHTSANIKITADNGSNNQGFAIHPSAPEVIYSGIETYGLYKSVDGGKSWKRSSKGIRKGRGRNIVSVLVDPADVKTVYAGTDGGFYKSTDAGANWALKTKGLPSGKVKANKDISLTVSNIVADPKREGTLYIGVYATGMNEPAGFFKSTDFGETWSEANEGIESGPLQKGGGLGGALSKEMSVGGLAMSPHDPKVLVGITFGGIYRTDDGAKTWTKILEPNGGAAVLFDPVEKERIYLAGKEGAMLMSPDGGKTWDAITRNLPTGKTKDAKPYKVNFTLPSGETIVADGWDKRFQNSVNSLAISPAAPDWLYLAGGSGLFRIKVR